ncbi:metallophosphoesterase family protein [Clostridium sp. ATCC 25772]|uniref:metallophosphoesterase family protein n=1 Tax=Clostridium sp. ATCC 25772 TaxID=1676991 RepID=UPI00078557FE|nr:metallophosphoesterase family protein [Clostridium sp. ATCC 25772]
MGKEKVLVIADIHSNMEAFNVFLQYAEKENVDKILNLGDFIQEGPNPLEVFDIIMNDKRFINILGNTDYSIVTNCCEEFTEGEKEHQKWNINLLGEERINKLKTVPTERIIEIKGKKILMVHSRIDSMNELPLLYQEVTLDEFTEDYGDVCDYVLIGHSHCQTLVKYWKGKPIINPGSIGCSRDGGYVSFAVMEFDDDGTVDISFKSIKYNIDKTIMEFFNENVPDKDNILKLFYNLG